MKNKLGKNILLLAIIILMSGWGTGCIMPSSVIESQNSDIDEVSEDTVLEIHYIDVGQADATLVMCGGDTMLIDGGNVDDSSLVYSYLKEHNVEKIDYLIATHAHEDHVGGLAAALNAAIVEHVYSAVTDYDTEAFRNFVKYVKMQEGEITVPKIGTEFTLGNAVCTIIAVNSFVDSQNDSSIVLKIEHGNNSFLFCGDIEQRAEKYILDQGYSIECNVLKVPHHGSSASLSYRWLREAMPEYSVISVGEENSYGHPAMETLDKLKDAEVKTYRTDLNGHIICFSDGKDLQFELQRNTIEVTEETDLEVKGEQSQYILNINTMKFHYPECSGVTQMKEKNKKQVSAAREDLITEGYSPCGNCKP